MRQIGRVSWLRWSCDELSYSALALWAEPVYSVGFGYLAAPAPPATGTPSVVGRDIEVHPTVTRKLSANPLSRHAHAVTRRAAPRRASGPLQDFRPHITQNQPLPSRQADGLTPARPATRRRPPLTRPSKVRTARPRVPTSAITIVKLGVGMAQRLLKPAQFRCHAGRSAVGGNQWRGFWGHPATLHYRQIACVAPKHPPHHSRHSSDQQTAPLPHPFIMA